MKKAFSVICLMLLLSMLLSPVPAYADAASYKHIDSAGGLSFTVPKNWTDETAASELVDLKAIFYSDRDEGSISYTYVDVWNEMNIFSKMVLPRSSFTNETYSAEDNLRMKKVFQESAEEFAADPVWIDESTSFTYRQQGTTVEAVYGGKTYYQADFQSEINGVPLYMTMLGHYNNGYYYLFYFYNYGDKDAQSDFETLMNSVQYTDVADGSDATYLSALPIIGGALAAILVIFLLIRGLQKRKS